MGGGMGDMPKDDGPAPRFDLTERTACFGENVIEFCLAVRLNAITSPLVSQLVRAAGSVGANYSEADESATRKEFRYRISLCKREAKESKHWLRLLAAAAPDKKEAARKLWKEAHELTLIFATIFRNSQD